jgi:hypothetical protein
MIRLWYIIKKSLLTLKNEQLSCVYGPQYENTSMIKETDKQSEDILELIYNI